MSERPDEHQDDQSLHSDERESVREETRDAPAVRGTGHDEVPAAQGTTATYTTGTLQPGDVGPAVDKPEHEGPTQGEGPVRPVQDHDADEFLESRVDRDVDEE